MTGGTGAVSTGCGGAQLAKEIASGAGTAYQDWPLVSALPPLAALPTAPACARGHVRAVAAEWGLQDLADTAELLVSELITNAVRASERLRVRADLAIIPVVQLWIVSDKSSLVIHCWDGNDEMPSRRDAGIDEESGRGLMLVESLGSDWGAYRNTTGKTVWVKIDPVNDWQETGYDRSR
jgi:anti-sigma regulatory factor (Ser/Thr protein kinase)